MAAPFQRLLRQVEALLRGEKDPVANAANLCAAVYPELADINWLGFYFAQGQTLVLGPFQGQAACTRIPFGQGVCGTAAQRRQTLIVPDVEQFPGHIACDAASRSEIVVPLLRHGRVLGVLDVDAPVRRRFGAAERAFFEALAGVYLAAPRP